MGGWVVGDSSEKFRRQASQYLGKYLNISLHIGPGRKCLAYRHVFVHIGIVLIYTNGILMLSPYRLRLSNVQNI